MSLVHLRHLFATLLIVLHFGETPPLPHWRPLFAKHA